MNEINVMEVILLDLGFKGRHLVQERVRLRWLLPGLSEGLREGGFQSFLILLVPLVVEDVLLLEALVGQGVLMPRTLDCVEDHLIVHLQLLFMLTFELLFSFFEYLLPISLILLYHDLFRQVLPTFIPFVEVFSNHVFHGYAGTLVGIIGGLLKVH
jgi:hypothetical protein